MPTFNWNEPSDKYDPRFLPLLDKHDVVLKEGDKVRIGNIVLTISFHVGYDCWIGLEAGIDEPVFVEALTRRIELILDNE